MISVVCIKINEFEKIPRTTFHDDTELQNRETPSLSMVSRPDFGVWPNRAFANLGATRYSHFSDSERFRKLRLRLQLPGYVVPDFPTDRMMNIVQNATRTSAVLFFFARRPIEGRHRQSPYRDISNKK